MKFELRSSNFEVQPYANPYVAGVGLGLVLLAAYVLAGRGLGASGAFSTTAAGIAVTVAPAAAHANPFFARYLDAAGGPWRDWLLFEIAGVVLGGFLSAVTAGRFRREIERGPALSPAARLAMAFAGGAVMGTGAVFARGCTSGQALTGGALLSAGSWIFIAAAFFSAYVVAPAVKWCWR